MTTHFIIDRTKWRTGRESSFQTGLGNTALLNEEGFMCCLGFCSLQLGAKKEDLLSFLSPKSITYLLNSNNPFIESDVNSALSNEAMEINDSELFSLEDKEDALKSLFEKFELSIEFIN